MNHLNSINKFFKDVESQSFENLLRITKLIIVQTSKNEEKQKKIIAEIFSILGINRPIPLFIKDIDEQIEIIKVKKDKLNTKKNTQDKTKDGLNKVSFFRVYNGLYRQIEQKYKNIENSPTINSQILFEILEYHLAFLKMKNIPINDENNKQYSDSFFDNTSLTATRAIELLINLQFLENDYINDLYFKEIEDIIENFINIISENEIEKTSYFIKEDREKGNYFYYENINNTEKLSFKCMPSRRVKTGATRTQGSNQNILFYFKNNLTSYLKIKDNLKKEYSTKSISNNNSTYKLQFTEIEAFLEGLTKQNNAKNISSYIKEEQLEIQSKVKLHKRNFNEDYSLKEDKKTSKKNKKEIIPNSYEQLKQNRAYSASIIKNRLVLPNDYNIPEINNYAKFIEHVALKSFNDPLSNIDIYNSIFLISVLTGFNFHDCINIFFIKNNIYEPKTGMLNISLLKISISPIKNDFFPESASKIHYLLPKEFILLIDKIRNILSLDLEKNHSSWQNGDNEKEYEIYIKSKISTFNKKIEFNIKNTWYFLISYIRFVQKEDITTIFCLAKNQQIDEGKLAYGSSAKNSTVFSNYLDEISKKLKLDKIINKMYINNNDFKRIFIEADRNQRAGSNRYLIPDFAKKFFIEIQKYINNSIFSKEDRFNLLSIKTRVALSILLGTRHTVNSCSLERISFNSNILTISEKSNSLLSGIRIIPLCDKAIEIIKEYQKIAKEINVPKDNIYLIIKNIKSTRNYDIYSKNKSINIAKNLKLNSFIMNFLEKVPLNTGRHIATKYAIEQNISQYYIDTFLGHYASGAEQFGIFSNMSMKDYIEKIRDLLQKISNIYGIF